MLAKEADIAAWVNRWGVTLGAEVERLEVTSETTMGFAISGQANRGLHVVTGVQEVALGLRERGLKPIRALRGPSSGGIASLVGAVPDQIDRETLVDRFHRMGVLSQPAMLSREVGRRLVERMLGGDKPIIPHRELLEEIPSLVDAERVMASRTSVGVVAAEVHLLELPTIALGVAALLGDIALSAPYPRSKWVGGMADRHATALFDAGDRAFTSVTIATQPIDNPPPNFFVAANGAQFIRAFQASVAIPGLFGFGVPVEVAGQHMVLVDGALGKGAPLIETLATGANIVFVPGDTNSGRFYEKDVNAVVMKAALGVFRALAELTRSHRNFPGVRATYHAAASMARRIRERRRPVNPQEALAGYPRQVVVTIPLPPGFREDVGRFAEPRREVLEHQAGLGDVFAQGVFEFLKRHQQG